MKNGADGLAIHSAVTVWKSGAKVRDVGQSMPAPTYEVDLRRRSDLPKL
jgi:hypothetical protein